MALIFLYAVAWRPLVAMLRRRMRVTSWDARRVSTWLGGIASALNLVFLVGFPLAFLERTEGGFPDFVYGVPVVASRLLLIPPGHSLHGRRSLNRRCRDLAGRTSVDGRTIRALSRGRCLALVRCVRLVLAPAADAADLHHAAAGSAVLGK
jgi:hypothetical protein